MTAEETRARLQASIRERDELRTAHRAARDVRAGRQLHASTTLDEHRAVLRERHEFETRVAVSRDRHHQAVRERDEADRVCTELWGRYRAAAEAIAEAHATYIRSL